MWESILFQRWLGGRHYVCLGRREEERISDRLKIDSTKMQAGDDHKVILQDPYLDRNTILDPSKIEKQIGEKTVYVVFGNNKGRETIALYHV